MAPLIRGYYLATPAFYVADRAFDANIRVAFLDHWPAGKTLYYILAFLLGIIAWRKPAWTARIGLLESGTNVGLLIISVAVWYAGVLDAAGSEFGMPQPVEPQALVNFVLAAAVAGGSYLMQRGSRAWVDAAE